MNLVTKYVLNSLKLTSQFLPLSALKNVLNSLLVVNHWCQKVKVLKVGRYSSSKFTVYWFQTPVCFNTYNNRILWFRGLFTSLQNKNKYTVIKMPRFMERTHSSWQGKVESTNPWWKTHQRRAKFRSMHFHPGFGSCLGYSWSFPYEHILHCAWLVDVSHLN